jgi:DUF971 family protein
MADPRPKHLDLDKDHGLTVEWDDGRASYYPIAFLRAMSPSADERERREQSQSNPLHVLGDAPDRDPAKVTALGAELVGNYAIRIRFSDGHDTGIYSWDYLRQIDPDRDKSA